MATIWCQEYANGTTVAAGSTPKDAAGTPTLAKWVQAVGAGTLVLTCEGGVVFTRHCLGGEVYAGSFTALTSNSCTYAVMGNGPAPIALPPAGLAVQGPVRTGAAGTQTNATATMAAITDLTMTVTAGQKVSGVLSLFANNSTAGEGLKFDLNGGTATWTSIEFGFDATPVGATVGVAISTAIGTALTATTVATTDVCYAIRYAGVVNAAGTVIPRFAEVSHTSGTATVEINSTASLATTSN